MRYRIWILAALVAVLAVGLIGCSSSGGTGGTGGGGGSTSASNTVNPTPYVEAWVGSAHAIPVVFAAQRTPCAGCHDGQCFAAGINDPSKLPTSTTEFGPYVVATDCRVCHTGKGAQTMLSGTADNVPTASGPVTGGKGAVCMSCHNQFGKPNPKDPQHGYPHYGPMADVLNGTGGMTTGLSLISTEKHKTIQDTCVACHKSSDPSSHSFKPTTNRCPECHNNFNGIDQMQAKADYDGDGNQEMFVDEVKGLQDSLAKAVNKAAKSDKFVAEGGELSFMSKGTTLTTVPEKAYVAAYNWVLIDHDKSQGIHNPYFTVTLLQETYRQLTGAALPNAKVPTPSSGQ